MSRSKKMYKNSPTMERGEDGKMGVKAAPQTSPDEDDSMPQGQGGMPASIRQAQERRDMNNRHETEHQLMDAQGGDKKDMHARQTKEMTDMQKRHESEGSEGENDSMPAGKPAAAAPVEKTEGEADF